MRPPFLLRLSNAFDALRGKPQRFSVDSLTIELNIDTSKFEADLERTKAQVAELAKLSDIPSPRLMVKTDRKVPREVRHEIVEHLQAAVESGKALLLEPGTTVYQLIAGRWQPIDAIPTEDAALLETKTQTFEDVSAEWNVPVDRLRAD